MKLKESEDDDEIEDDAEEADTSTDGDVEASETDNVGDASVEINVEDLIHELEVVAGGRPGGELAARRRLEEIMEQKRSRRDVEDFDDYDV
jgi:hypothetical protein